MHRDQRNHQQHTTNTADRQCANQQQYSSFTTTSLADHTQNRQQPNTTVFQTLSNTNNRHIQPQNAFRNTTNIQRLTHVQPSTRMQHTQASQQANATLFQRLTNNDTQHRGQPNAFRDTNVQPSRFPLTDVQHFTSVQPVTNTRFPLTNVQPVTYVQPNPALQQNHSANTHVFANSNAQPITSANVQQTLLSLPNLDRFPNTMEDNNMQQTTANMHNSSSATSSLNVRPNMNMSRANAFDNNNVQHLANRTSRRSQMLQQRSLLSNIASFTNANHNNRFTHSPNDGVSFANMPFFNINHVQRSNSTRLNLDSMPKFQITLPSETETARKNEALSLTARQKDALRKRKQRAKETAEQRKERLRKDAERHRRRRAKDKQNATPQQLALQRRQNAARQRKRRSSAKTPMFLLDSDIDDYDPDLIQALNVGDQTETCPHCKAQLWPFEVGGTKEKPTYGVCCVNGKLQLHPIPKPPKRLQKLWKDRDSPMGKYFHKYIRALNCALAMARLDCSQVQFKGYGPYVFKIQGMVHQKTSSIAPEPGQEHAFAQIYILDPEQQTKRRLQLNGLTGKNGKYTKQATMTLDLLQKVLLKHNHLIQTYRTAYETCINDDVPNVDIVLQKDVPNKPTRTYNLPTAAEIAAIVPVSPSNHKNRNIVIEFKRGNAFDTIDETNCAYEALQYVLFYPRATLSYPQGVKHLATKLSQRKFYAYRLFTRRNEFNVLHRGGRLFQQWCVDMYAKLLQYKINWAKSHQKEIRSEVYCGLEDCIDDDDIEFIGKKVILPASMTYTPRWYSQKYYDAMSIVGRYQKPDLFITFTCNKNWPEIQNALWDHQTPEERAEIVARVFNEKLKCLMHDLTQGHVFGKTIAWMHTIEFQKRGNPHAHILIIFDSCSKLRCAEDFDRIVCAEIPDPEQDQELHDLVCKFMIHKPCGKNSGQPCMKKGSCQSHFPKEFIQWTRNTEESYPEYRRRSPKRGGLTGYTKIGNKLVKVDNRWVVPYNPYLLKKYNAHVNVEICCNITATKYIYKYVYKGHDKASYSFQKAASGGSKVQMSRNEITRYFDGFYLSPPEACWKLLKFEMHSRYPSVQQLQVHLPKQHLVYYTTNETVQEILAKDTNQRTTLTEWFKNNEKETRQPLQDHVRGYDDSGNAKPTGPELAYWQYPEYYTWEKKRWKRREKGLFALGRMWRLSPASGEQYYLRILLIYVKGATSYKDLLTFNNVQHNTFKEACIARNLLADDKEWERCLTDAALMRTGNQLIALFTTILLECEVLDARKLWLKYKVEFGADIKHSLTTNSNYGQLITEEMIDNLVLVKIANRLERKNLSLSHFGLPEPTEELTNLNEEILCEKNYNAAECVQQANESYQTMSDEQKQVFNAVKQAVDEPHKVRYKVFFCNAIGGAGKTFVAQALLAYVRGQKHVALAVAFSGIAALLLIGGRTLHSRFKLPIDFDDTSLADIRPRSALAELIRETKLIIWDEAPMAHRHVLECLDRSFQEICKNKEPFGGKIIFMSGDWRQTLPVCPRASRSQIVNSCLNRSPLWKHVQEFSLVENQRVKRLRKQGKDVTTLAEFANTVKQIGDGTSPALDSIDDELVRIPDAWLSKAASLQEFIHEAYPNLQQRYRDAEYLQGRAILTPLNKTVTELNQQILNQIPGAALPPKRSIDTNIAKGTSSFNYPEEILNNIDPPGMPPHLLHLKEHAIVMMLRNLDPANGVCNGTRLKVLRFTDNVIEAQILTGPFKGNNYFIPRIPIGTNKQSPIPFIRRQFPIRLAYVMTINKAQGQTLKFMGLYLPEPVFGHGQLYVACGRVGSPDRLSIYIIPGKAHGIFKGYPGWYSRNVVYKEVFGQQSEDIEMKQCEQTEDIESKHDFEMEDFNQYSTESDATDLYEESNEKETQQETLPQEMHDIQQAIHDSLQEQQRKCDRHQQPKKTMRKRPKPAIFGHKGKEEASDTEYETD